MLDLWLMVVMCAYVIEICLIAFPVPVRFSIGWYGGRGFGLLSGSLVLFVLLYEITLLYRRRAEDRLREQARLLNLTHDTIFVRDMDDVITYWNRGAEVLYGWVKEEALGKISHELMHTAFPAALAEINAELLRTDRWEGELTQTRRDGTQVMVASRWSLQRDEQGRPVAILETNNDVTASKRAAEYSSGWGRSWHPLTTRSSARRWEGSLPVGMPAPKEFWLRSGGGLRAADQHSHPPDRQYEGQTIIEKSGAKKAFATLKPSGSGRRRRASPRFFGYLADQGRRRPDHWRIQDRPRHHRAQSSQAERARLGERLREGRKDKAIGRLAGGIAHDFNNVLGGILAYGEMLFEEAPADSARKRYAHNVLTAATPWPRARPADSRL